MREFRVWIGQRYVGTIRADTYEQAVERARVKWGLGVFVRVRVSNIYHL